MKKHQVWAALLAFAMLLAVAAGCSSPAPQTTASDTINPEQFATWAQENGYVLKPEENGYVLDPESKGYVLDPESKGYVLDPESKGYVLDPENNGYMKYLPDVVASATLNKAGGVNYGAIEWDAALQETAIREFLKGGKYLGDPSFAQDETGNNYREMYQLATSYNNVPSNTNLELVLDADTLHLVGSSEANTGKTIEFLHNPSVSVSWCRQLRLEDEENGYNYYCSYGVQINGTVRIYTHKDLETPEGEAAILNCFDTYYPTLASTWGAYSAGFAGETDKDAIHAAKLAYAKKTLEAGSMILYEIVPQEIIITAPFLMNMVPQMANAMGFATVQPGGDKYAYDLFLSDDFLDALVAYKADFISSAEGEKTVNEYYSGPMYEMLDGYCAQYGMPTSKEMALNPQSAAGLKTQTTYTPAQ